jgi:CelD/BcsL family acetyltransferase involved in cellulose biosynthesis
MLTGRVVTDVAELEDAAAAWDALAVAAGRPYCTPAWMLAWWRHLAPPEARLHAVLVHDGGSLVGLLPTYLQSTAARLPVLRLLTGGFTARLQPLAAAGREADTARCVAAALAEHRPVPAAVVLEALPADSSWPEALAAASPGRGAWLHEDFTMDLPLAVPGAGGADAWMQARSKNYRKESGRVRRRLEEAGGVIRRADAEEIGPATEEALRLYRARWEPRGGSDRTSPRVARMLLDAGSALAAARRFDVWLLEADGTAVGAEVFVRAGAESSAWGGGFLPEWARFAPSTTLMLEAIRHGADEGVERVDLGEGVQPYKQRFTDEVQRLRWTTLLPRGRHYPLARAQEVPRHVRRWARERARRLPPDVQDRLRALRRRMP